MSAYNVMTIFYAVVAMVALQAAAEIVNTSGYELRPDTMELLRKNIGYQMDNRENSLYNQNVNNMHITHVERLPHGYTVDAQVEIAYTGCLKNQRFEDQPGCEQKVAPNMQAKSCEVTITMVQPQGGRKWYKLNVLKCTAA